MTTQRQRQHRSPDELIDEILPSVLECGLQEFSLRSAASELGTSHKVLLHHFGSRAEMIAAILRRVRAQLLADTGDTDLLSTFANAWHWSAGNADRARLLSQGLGLAILDPDQYATVLTDSLAQYLPGADADAGPPGLARLALAAMRGLQIDRRITGDTAGTDAAFTVLMQLLGALQDGAVDLGDGAAR